MPFDSKDLTWNGLELRHGKRLVATVIPEPEFPGVYRSPSWPKMYRVQIGSNLTDTVNLTRAKDAAIALALADLNRRKAA
jgi:hypothetical protein